MYLFEMFFYLSHYRVEILIYFIVPEAKYSVVEIREIFCTSLIMSASISPFPSIDVDHNFLFDTTKINQKGSMSVLTNKTVPESLIFEL